MRLNLTQPSMHIFLLSKCQYSSEALPEKSDNCYKLFPTLKDELKCPQFRMIILAIHLDC